MWDYQERSLKGGNTIGKTTVLKSLNILLILLKNYYYCLLMATVSYYHNRKLLEVACCILTGDCATDLYQRKEEFSVKDKKQRRRMRTDFWKCNLEEFSRHTLVHQDNNRIISKKKFEDFPGWYVCGTSYIFVEIFT